MAWFYILKNLFSLIKDSWSRISPVLEKVYQEISRLMQKPVGEGKTSKTLSQGLRLPPPHPRCPQMTPWEPLVEICLFASYVHIHDLILFPDHHGKNLGDSFIKMRKPRLTEADWLLKQRMAELGSETKSRLLLWNLITSACSVLPDSLVFHARSHLACASHLPIS